jgi:integration host factor subunit beta
MTKADLIDEVSRVAELTRKDSEIIVESIFDSVVRSLRAGDKIEIRGFGSFRTRQRRARVGRNPKTGDRVEVPPKKIPFFKPSKELKDLVNSIAAAATGNAPPAPPAGSVAGESRGQRSFPTSARSRQCGAPASMGSLTPGNFARLFFARIILGWLGSEDRPRAVLGVRRFGDGERPGIVAVGHHLFAAYADQTDQALRVDLLTQKSLRFFGHQKVAV